MSEAARRRLHEWGADTAIVLGSGLSSLVEETGPAECVPYAAFSELPLPAVAGHPAQFALSRVADQRVVFAQGRVHLYEGHSAVAVTAAIRLLSQCGVRRVILTNAAGAINPQFTPGTWMMISDHLNLTGTTPLLGSPKFVDMTDVYTARWRTEFRSAAADAAISLREGAYAGLVGPQYETPAEVRMLARLGADAVGMSTVLEAIEARALGMEVAGFSCLTNWAAGISGNNLCHSEVLSAGRAAAGAFRQLLFAAFSRR